MKILKWFVCSVVILLALAWLGMRQLANSGCETQIFDTVKSPRGTLEAVAYRRGCGVLVDSEYSVLLTIRKSKKTEPPVEEDAIFAIDDYGVLPSEHYDKGPAKLTLTWRSESELQVEFPKGPHKLKAEPSANGVMLHYLQADH